MATQRNLLLSRSSTSARVQNFPRCWWYIFRSLACVTSSEEKQVVIGHKSSCPVSKEDFVYDPNREQCTCDFGKRLAKHLNT